MSMEPLVYLPVDRWQELKEVFELDLPRSISGLTVLETLKEISDRGLDYGFKVYCPFGELSNGIVIINIKGTFIEIIVQSPKDDTRNLEEALLSTKLIDWNRTFQLPFAPKHIMDCLIKIGLKKNFTRTQYTVTDTFILDKNKPIFKDVRVPVRFSFKLLKLEHVKLVDSTWPHRYEDSYWYFEMLIRTGLGYGLFKDEELIAWVFIKEMGALGHLYTVEEHRKKGYGELVLKLISNILLKQKKYVVAFCVEGNGSAYHLYKQLGFELTDEVQWCLFSQS